MNVTKPDYALNPHVLRAVFNNYAINMTEPCQEYIYRQRHGWYLTMKTEEIRMKGKRNQQNIYKELGTIHDQIDSSERSSESSPDSESDLMGSGGSSEKGKGRWKFW